MLLNIALVHKLFCYIFMFLKNSIQKIFKLQLVARYPFLRKFDIWLRKQTVQHKWIALLPSAILHPSQSNQYCDCHRNPSVVTHADRNIF